MALGDLLSFPLPQTPGLLPGMDIPQGTTVLPSPPDSVQGNPQLAQNKSMWQRFLGNLQDPNVRQALFQTGVGLMRTPEFGKSGWDTAADALGSGANTLQALRERDRQAAVQAADKKQAQGNKEAELWNDSRRTGAYETQVGQTAEQARKALEETTRSNKENERIRGISAEADRTRANAYSGAGGGRGGQQPQDIQKINMLAAEYQAQGMDEISARAKATRFVETAATARTPSQQILDMVKDDIAGYNANPANWRTPLTPEMQQKMMDQAIERVMKLQQIDANARGEPLATNTGGPIQRSGQGATPVGAPGGNGFPPPQDPKILAQVNALKARNTPPETIRSALVQQGLDPKSYGY